MVDTFLLPSLVTAILYLSDALSSDRPQEQKAIVRILQLILQLSSISNEASTLLSAVLNIVAKPLEHSLRSYQRQDPKSQAVEPLLRALKENIALSRRTGAADYNELETWTSTANGGFVAAIRHTIQGLVQWSLHPGVNATPTSYTHRQFLGALKMLGAPRLLQVILDEIKHQTDVGSGNIAYDVACALICAPDAATDAQAPPPMSILDGAGTAPAPLQRRISLREQLGFMAEEWKKIQKSDPVVAETVVRLYRKVEAQMAVPPDPVMPTGLELHDATALGDAMAVAAVAAAAGAAGGDAMTLDTVDLGLGGGDLGLGGSATNSVGGGLDMDQDIFGGLGALEGWDMEVT